MLEVMLDPAGIAHAAGGKDDRGTLQDVESLRFFRVEREMDVVTAVFWGNSL